MPAILDQCVESLLGKWKEKPSSRPKHKEGQKAQAQAFALCTASLKKAGKLEHDDETFYLTEDVEFELPVMTAWALTNKPHIMGLDELSFVNAEGEPWVEGSEGEKHLKVPLLVMGKWKHRMGILNFTKGLADKIEKNGPCAIRAIKESVTRSLGMNLEDALGQELLYAAKVFGTEDAREGPRAFA